MVILENAPKVFRSTFLHFPDFLCSYCGEKVIMELSESMSRYRKFLAEKSPFMGESVLYHRIKVEYLSKLMEGEEMVGQNLAENIQGYNKNPMEKGNDERARQMILQRQSDDYPFRYFLSFSTTAHAYVISWIMTYLCVFDYEALRHSYKVEASAYKPGMPDKYDEFKLYSRYREIKISPLGDYLKEVLVWDSKAEKLPRELVDLALRGKGLRGGEKWQVRAELEDKIHDLKRGRYLGDDKMLTNVEADRIIHIWETGEVDHSSKIKDICLAKGIGLVVFPDFETYLKKSVAPVTWDKYRVL